MSTFLSSRSGGNEVGDEFEEFSEEIRGIINEMGYNVEEEELREIEKDLRILEENADVSDSHLFSCLLGRFDDLQTSVADPEKSLRFLADALSPSPNDQQKSTPLPKEFGDFILNGYGRLQEVYEDIKRYEKLLDQREGGEKKDGVPEEEQAGPSSSKGVVAYAPRELEAEKENELPILQQRQQPNGRKQKRMDPREETRQLNRFLRENALRATKCPAPGRLPFKHDRQLKLEQYRKEWAKLPPPGEQKRMALRWRIRELMLRRDIPHLRFLPFDDEEGEEEGKAPNWGNGGRQSANQPEWKH